MDRKRNPINRSHLADEQIPDGDTVPQPEPEPEPEPPPWWWRALWWPLSTFRSRNH